MRHYTKHLATLALSALLGILPAMADVLFNATNFPDPNFRKALMEYSSTKPYFTKLGVTVSSANLKKITYLYIPYYNISNLKGIEYFTSLTGLVCSNNNLTSLNISKLTLLNNLTCDQNQLTSLNVSTNTKLDYLSCGANKLTSIDVSKLTLLTYFSCYNNQISKLDVTKNIKLESLNCNHNKLTTINVTKNTALKSLSCGNNDLTSINVSNNTQLTTLDFSSCKLKNIDVTKNTKLDRIGCLNNELTTLNLSKNLELTTLQCSSNHLTSLDLSYQKKLTNLVCGKQTSSGECLIFSNTEFGLLRPSGAVASNILDMKVNGTTYSQTGKTINGTGYQVASNVSFTSIIDILWNGSSLVYNYNTKCASTKYANQKMDVTMVVTPYIACGDNNGGSGNFPDTNFRTIIKTSTYDKNSDGKLSKAELQAITNLDVANKSIAKLNGLEYMKYLQSLNCNGNKLGAATTLPLTFNTELTTLNCFGSTLSGLDVSKNTKLQTLNAYNNNISGTLNLSNHSALKSLNVNNNKLSTLTLPSQKTTLVTLICNKNQLSTLSATDYTAMTLMDCSNNLLKTLTVAGNSKLETFNCSNNQLTSLTLPTTKTALLDLNCNTNQLTVLNNINQYTNLTSLNCGVNKLTTLNLTDNTKLKTLDCASQIDRSLKQLTLPNTTTLADVKCHDNSLTELNFTNNTGLTALDCSTNNLTALDLSANTALTSLDYSNQTRDIVAEWGETFVGRDAQGNAIHDNFYYLRLDNNKTGIEKTIIERMTDTNYGKAASTFVPGNVFEWTSGGTVVEGTKGKNNVASVDDVRPKNVVGDILVLTDVTEQDGVANGSVSYKYNVNNRRIDPNGDKGDFTLNWVTESDVVTEVTDLGAAQREVVAVEYHNLAGMSSDRPWQGVNIVVTRYSDGTTTTSKVVR